MVTIRSARLPEDKPAFLSFIMGSQHYEHAFEKNRRLDPPVAEEYFALLQKDVTERGGEIFTVEDDAGRTIGWGVVFEDEDDVYVIGAERRYAYISELFVIDEARGLGAGRALIAACEAWARARGITVMQIGVLPGNVRAHGIYQRQGYSDYGIQLRKYLR